MHSLPLLLLLSSFHIDYATFLGGSLDEFARAVAVDSAGNAYVTGTTDSSNFLTSARFGFPSAGASCAFVAKLNPSATSILWAVCLSIGAPNAIGVDAAQNVYVLVGLNLFKLSPNAETLIYTKTLASAGTGLAVDAAGNAYVVGSTNQGIPTTPGAYQPNLAAGMCNGAFPQDPPVPCLDAFAMKLAPDGITVYATYLGGSGPDQATAVAIDSQGDAWITGNTVSKNFPTTANALQSKFHGEIDLGPLAFGDAFVAKLDPTGGKLLYSTYLGGSQADGGLAITVDSTGAAYVAGATESPDFPTTPGVLQPAYSGPLNGPPALFGNGFISKFSAAGGLVYSTFTSDPEVSAIAVDSSGAAHFQGSATSVLSADGGTILHSAPIGGLLPYPLNGAMAIDSAGAVYLAQTSQGYVYFPTPGAAQAKFGGGTYDATVTKIDFSGAQTAWVSSIVNAASMRSGEPQKFPVFQIAPGEIISIFGLGFDSSTRLLFDGITATILFAEPNQINAVVPFEVNVSGTAMTLQSDGETFGQSRMDVFAAVPGIFTANGSGTGQAAALNQDGSVNSASNPAARGSVISVFMTGTGAMNPGQADGSVTPLTGPYPLVTPGAACNLGPVTYAGAAPGLMAGAAQVNVQISTGAPTGDQVPIVIYIGNFASSGGPTAAATIAVR